MKKIIASFVLSIFATFAVAQSSTVTTNGTQTITGAKSFNSAKLKLKGATSGTGTLNAPTTVTGAQIWTFPDATGTIALSSSFVPGGSNTQVQFNNAGAFGGIPGATTNGTTLTLVAPVLGTPASGVATNLTGTAAGLTAGTVTTNANLTGPITSVGNATSIAAQTGTGTTFAMSASPTFTGTVGAAAINATGTVNVTNASANAATLILGGVADSNKIVGDPLHLIEIINNNTTSQVGRFSTYGTAVSQGGTTYINDIHFFAARGTLASPTALLSGDPMMSFGSRGWDGAVSTQSSTAFATVATENWSATAHGTKFTFDTTPNGSITRAQILSIDSSGLIVNTNVANTNGLLATSATNTGAVIIRAANSASGAGSYSLLRAENGTQALNLLQYGTSFTASGLVSAGTARIYASNDLLIGTLGGGDVIFPYGDTATASEIARVTSTGFKIRGALAIPAGGTAATGISFSSTANFGIYFGSGAPSLSAAKGSLYLRSDGTGVADRAYINTNGSTTWTSIATAG